MANLVLLLLFISTFSWSTEQPENVDELLKRKDLTYQDLAHKYRGCPENSLCNQLGAQDTLKWEQILETTSPTAMKEYSRKFGVVANILGNEESNQRFNGVLWDSPCQIHQKPKSGKKIYKLQVHIKKSNPITTVVQSNGLDYEIPRNSKLAWTEPVTIKVNDRLETYFGPHNERPVYFSNKRLFYLLDYNDLFYTVSIGLNGDWRIEEKKEGPKEAFTGLQSFDCPEELKTATIADESHYYAKNFCQELYDLDSKKFIPMLRRWSCH